MVSALHWMIANMPNLRAIACLGKDSWHLTATALGRPNAAKSAKEFRDTVKLLRGSYREREIVASSHFHPSRGSDEQVRTGWAELAAHLNAPHEIARAA